MTRWVRFAGWPTALLAGISLAGCASQTDYSRVSTSPVTMACDNGKTFTVSYTNGFETAVVETDGQRRELERVRTTLGLTPTPGALGNPDSPQFESTSPGVERGGGGPSATTAGTTGVRYSGDDAYYLSRNQGAVLQIGDQTYSNCQVART